MSADLTHLLAAYSIEKKRPDGSRYISLGVKETSQLAIKTNNSVKSIEIAALEHDIIPERYCRNLTSISSKEQLRLLRAHVAIIGLGGLGGTVMEILARIGTGKMTLVDGDVFDDSNLNRQLLSSPANIGFPKSTVAADRIREINSAIEIFPHNSFFSTENGENLLQGADLAIDCLDTVSDRFTLEAVCRKCKIPMVSAAIGGSCGQATVIFPQDPGLKLIYGNHSRTNRRGAEATLGTLPFAAVYMAAVECAEAVTLLLGKKPKLRKKLFLADTREHTSELIHFT